MATVNAINVNAPNIPDTSNSSVSNTSERNKTDVVQFKIPALPLHQKKRIVLEEDKYALQLEKIIERDYFPDLEKLNAQNAYLNAMATNDIHMLRELYSKYSFGKKTPRTTKPDTLDTPSTFETPIDLQPKTTPLPHQLPPGTPTHLPMEEPSVDEDESASTIATKAVKSKDPSSMSLNEYLNTYTSEDNQSFQEFMEEAERKHRVKYSWLYDTEDSAAQQQITSLLVPSIEQQAEVYQRPLDIETWGYKTKNHIMYVPEGVALTQKEEIELAKKKAVVNFANTRFKKTPFKEGTSSTSQSTETPSLGKGLFKSVTEGKIGVDGKEIESSTPKVNGFSYVRTPSPTPGQDDVEESPFMTWGEIEGTPFRLDAGDTPLLAAATTKPYKIFEQSKREKLAMELAEKVSHRYRDKKLKAIQAARSHLATPSPSGLKRGIEKLSSMTPAAQKFAKTHFGSRIGSSDEALRNSYTPKRIGTPGSSMSSMRTSTSTPTPGSFNKSKNTTPSSKPTGLSRPPTLTTDNLLKLPVQPMGNVIKRSKAADYF